MNNTYQMDSTQNSRLPGSNDAQRICTYCRKRIMGRADKKFCDHQCRNEFNNRKNGELPATIRNINNMLKRNRQILAAVCLDSAQTTIGRRFLEEQGFSFIYHTGAEQKTGGTTIRYCYDYSYSMTDDNDWVIIKKPPSTSL